MRVQRFAVFDCTQAEGYAATRVPFAWLASALAWFWTRRTGRIHDYDTDD